MDTRVSDDLKIIVKNWKLNQGPNQQLTYNHKWTKNEILLISRLIHEIDGENQTEFLIEGNHILSQSSLFYILQRNSVFLYCDVSISKYVTLESAAVSQLGKYWVKIITEWVHIKQQ